METAIETARTAFALTLTEGLSTPSPWHLEMSDGAVHVKGAAIPGEATFSVKMSSGFPGNVHLGQPTSSGFTAVFDSTTGAVSALLLDNGYLTELRTGAAGALAADLLAPAGSTTAAIIGTGGQARHQLEGLFAVRAPATLRVCGRSAHRVAELAAWVRNQWDIDVRETADPAEAIEDAHIVITATSATAPLFAIEALAPDAHVTAVGSDTPGKRELPVDLVTSAALVAVDSVAQSQRLGELQGVDIDSISTLVTMGDLVTAPRRRPAGRTLADLSGLGLQDVTVAAAAVDALT